MSANLPEETISALVAASRALVEAYGPTDEESEEDSGESVDWEDLDSAHALAKEALALVDEGTEGAPFPSWVSARLNERVLLISALREIIASAPDEEPEYPDGPDYDGEAAETWGLLQGGWDAAEIARAALRTVGELPAKPEPEGCECHGAVHPHLSGVLLMHTASEEEYNVERCDLCSTFATDEDAADALRALGWVIDAEINAEDAEDADEGLIIFPVSYLIVTGMPLTARAVQDGAR